MPVHRLDAVAATFHDDGSLSARTEFTSSIAALEAVLLPHLRREEVLGIVGHWMGDSLDPERFDTLVHAVGPVTRFILLHMFDGPYRRACAVRWGPDVPVGPLDTPR
ncbi:hypothetical protein [Rhodococcus sp. ACT016]|uniref:hypothetical protein n=1 Tax=Rhodococcus sp. ACT016 TaxID=3134808 RepID=UPI003D2A25D8